MAKRKKVRKTATRSRLYTTSEAARKLGITTRQLRYRLEDPDVFAKTVPKVDIVGGRHLLRDVHIRALREFFGEYRRRVAANRRRRQKKTVVAKRRAASGKRKRR